MTNQKVADGDKEAGESWSFQATVISYFDTLGAPGRKRQIGLKNLVFRNRGLIALNSIIQ